MRGGRLLIVAAFLVFAVAATARPAQAATTRLMLQDETLVVAPNGSLNFTVAVTGAPTDAEIVVRVCRNLRTGETMADAIAGRLDCAALGLFPRIVVTGSGPVTITWPSYSRKADKPVVALGDPDPVQLPNIGTYPVQIEVHSGDQDEIVARLTTFIIRAPIDTTLPTIAVSAVFALPDYTTLQPDGSTVLEPKAKDEIIRLTQLLEARPSDPLTVSVSPAAIAALSASPVDRHLVTDLVAALGDRPLLPRTFDGLSLSGALAAGVHDDVVAELRAGEDAIRAATGRAPDRRTWLVDDTVDNATVATLGDLGASQLLIPTTALGLNADDRVHGRLALRLDDSPDRLSPDVAAIDAVASETLVSGSDPVLATYRLAASWLSDAYASVSTASFGSTASTGVMLVAPDRWWEETDSTPEQTLGALARIPQLHLVGLDDWFRTVSPARDGGAPMTRRVTPRDHPDLTGIARDLDGVRREVTATASMLPGGSLSPDVEPLLRTSLAAGLDDATRQSYLQTVRAQLATIRDCVEPIPKRTITIAGGVTRLPLSLRSTCSEAIRVKLRLTSSKLKFLGAEGFADSSGRYEQVVVLPPNEDLRLVIPVESRATNTFPLIVEVLTPTGDSGLVPPSELTVRANRLSGLGVALSAGGLVVLATWWAHHLRRNRRARHAASSAGRHPSANGPADDDTAADAGTAAIDTAAEETAIDTAAGETAIETAADSRSTSLAPP